MGGPAGHAAANLQRFQPAYRRRSLVIAIEPRGYVERGSGGDADMRPGACLRVSERLGLGQKRRRESGQALETYKDSIVFFYGENRTCDRDTVVDVGLA